MEEAIRQYKDLGKQWLRGEIDIPGFGELTFNPKQHLWLNNKNRYNLFGGGMYAGKTITFVSKAILLAHWFPGTVILMGRKTKTNARETFMEEFPNLLDAGWEDRVGDGKIVFWNGSEIQFWGLDALQSGDGNDTKKAIQNLKSHNFGFIFIDQLEEIEQHVFESLNTRMRRRQCRHGRSSQTFVDATQTPHTPDEYDALTEKPEVIYEICSECDEYTFNQFNLTINPVNHWSYSFFKSNPRPMTHLVETSMLDNREYVSESVIQSELQKPKRYVQKYVYGEWTPEVLTEGAVFYEEHFTNLRFFISEPLRELDGMKIFEEPANAIYQIGVDPSEGAQDPCCIKVMNTETGEEVASYSGFVPLHNVAERTLRLAHMYSLFQKPRLVIEVQGGGQQVIEQIRKAGYEKIYEREVYNHRQRRYSNKLGFHTNYATKLQLIDNFQELLSKNFVRIRERETLNEMQTFVWSDDAQKKGAGAQSGYHDDRVMATMLALVDTKPATPRENMLLSKIQEQNERKTIEFQYE